MDWYEMNSMTLKKAKATLSMFLLVYDNYVVTEGKLYWIKIDKNLWCHYLYNALPSYIKDIKNLKSFKKQVRETFLKAY